MLRGEEMYKLKFNDADGYDAFSKQLCFKKDEAAKLFISELIRLHLLATDGEYIWSEDLCQRMEKMDENRRSYSLRGKKSAAMRQQKKQEQCNIDAKENLAWLQQDPTHNNTKQDNTIHNNIMMMVKEEPTPSPKRNENDTSLIAQKLLADEMHFVHPHCKARSIDKVQLQQWLHAFNTHLQYLGERQKSEKDYRSHFAHWFKFQDVMAGAAMYQPLPAQKPVPTGPPPKTHKELVEELYEEARLANARNATLR